MFLAINLVCSSLIMSLVPATTSVGTLSSASSSGAMFGSFTMRLSISALRCARTLQRAKSDAAP